MSAGELVTTGLPFAFLTVILPTQGTWCQLRGGARPPPQVVVKRKIEIEVRGEEKLKSEKHSERIKGGKKIKS